LSEEWKTRVDRLEEEVARCKDTEKQLRTEMKRKSDAAQELMLKKDELVARRSEEIERLRSKRDEEALSAAAVESKSISTSDQTEEQVSELVNSPWSMPLWFIL